MCGWRNTYKLFGTFGLIVGLLGFLVIKEPKRNSFKDKSPPKEEFEAISGENKIVSSFREILTNPVLRFSGLATACRTFANYAFDFYLPTFFMQTYPSFTNEFSILMSFIVVSCGVLSSLIGGFLADKYSKHNHLAYSWICVGGSLLAWPFFTMAFLMPGGNFWAAMACISMRYLLGECFWSPNVAMIQNSVPQNKFSTIFGAINFFVLIAGCASTFVFGQIVNYLGCAQSPVVIGKLLAAFGGIGYVGSAVSWWKAGRAYKRMR